MPEEAEKPADGASPKKSKLGLIIGIGVAAVTLVGGSVAGAVLGPKLLGGADEQKAATDKGHDEGEPGAAPGTESQGPEHIVTADIPPVVVDLRDEDGRIRHLKVGLTAELADKVPAEDFRLVVPRGREAALLYLRALPFEQVADPQYFATIKEELAKRVTEAVGKHRVHRMMLTDFVLQ